MLRDDVRVCDVCGEIIPRGTPYRAGWTTPAALPDLLEGAADYWPTYSTEPDGTVRLDVCVSCGVEGNLEDVTAEAVDPLN